LNVFVYDAALVLCTLLMSGAFPVALIVFALWAQSQQTKVQSPDLTVLSAQDVFLAPWNVTYRTLGKDTIAVCGAVLFFLSMLPFVLSKRSQTATCFLLPPQAIVVSAFSVFCVWLELLCFISPRKIAGFEGFTRSQKNTGTRNFLRLLLQLFCLIIVACYLSLFAACTSCGDA